MFISRRMTGASYATHTGYRKIQPTVMKPLTAHMRICSFVCVCVSVSVCVCVCVYVNTITVHGVYNVKQLASFQVPLQCSFSLGNFGFPQWPVTTHQNTPRKIPEKKVLNKPPVMPRFMSEDNIKMYLKE